MAFALASVPAPAAAAACPTPYGHVMATHNAGPQAVTVIAQPEAPVVGPIRMVVALCDTRSGTPVEGASVTLTPTNPAGVTGRPAIALSRGNPGQYSADLSVKQGGDWHYTVRVSSALGDATVDAPVSIRQPEGGDAEAGWLFVVVAAALAGGGFYIARQTRKAILTRR